MSLRRDWADPWLVGAAIVFTVIGIMATSWIVVYLAWRMLG